MSPSRPVPSDNGHTDPRIGTVLADRYRIDQLLGEGGMGRVYKAEHVLMRKQLAIKVLHNELTNVPEVVARFEREARAAANIEHPNIATATDFGKLPDGAVYLALEFVKGRSLRDEIAVGPMPPERALKIARQIASALASAHALKIVHRDLKPENVMLVRKGNESDFVKVLDFGIAKVPIDVSEEGLGDKPITKVGMIFGTPEYMAPEQALSKPVDGRSDIYSLGVVFYELLAGIRPFSSKHSKGILGQQLSGPPPAFSQKAPGVRVPPQVEWLVMQLLKVEADQRPQKAADVVNMIDALLVQPFGETGQIFTQIGGTMVASGSVPDLLSAPAPSAMPSSPELRPGSVPDGARDPFGSAPGSLPGTSSSPDGVAAGWPASPPDSPGSSPFSGGAPGSQPDGALAGIGFTAESVSQRMPSDPRAGQASHSGVSTAGLIPVLERPWPKPILELFAWIDTRRPSLPEPLRNIPAPAYLGAAVALLGMSLAVLILVVGAVATSGSRATEQASAGTSAARTEGAPIITPAEGPSPQQLEEAKKSGSKALQALSEKYPKNPGLLLELAKAYRLEREYSKTVGIVGKALALDPKLNESKEVASMLWRTAQNKDSMEAAFGLLEGPMGAKGAEIVYDLVVAKKVRSSVKKRGSAFLESEQFQRQASPALKVAVALRSAKTCAAKHELLPQAKAAGDKRALRYLRRYESTRGCGRRRSRDCYPCMRGDTRLREAITAVEKRSQG